MCRPHSAAGRQSHRTGWIPCVHSGTGGTCWAPNPLTRSAAPAGYRPASSFAHVEVHFEPHWCLGDLTVQPFANGSVRSDEGLELGRGDDAGRVNAPRNLPDGNGGLIVDELRGQRIDVEVGFALARLARH